MAAQIISAIQRKGGACKSTMLQCLGAQMGADGAKVLIIDTDTPQFSCIEWATEEDITNVDTLEHADEDSVFDILQKAKPLYDVILIDTGGYDSRMVSYIIQASDLILIPAGSSKSSVIGAGQTWKHALNSTINNRTPPKMRIVVWGVKKNTSVYKHALDMIKAANLSMVSTHISHLTGFETMSWNGGLPNQAAARAVNGFIAALQNECLLWFYENNEGAKNGKAT